ncbi:transcriptional regulator [Nonlabens sp. YIK11]|uniref:helix-turn-helix domain-containing protein n=1 Tax=Nonlabens sp. YIK11 TaxID=1453349 RepID=UPI0006DBF505|nr:AraC family transcriptional regulator [Nonlabens sp. YIK11]KQC32839.1 transcriptional regulator [Nonlabens sp. YIK11]
MKHEFRDDKDDSLFVLTSFQGKPSLDLLDLDDLYKIIWCHHGKQSLVVDGYRITLQENQILFCTPNNKIQIQEKGNSLKASLFNREFYCIRDHDNEVSCMGLLFYGSSSAPVIKLGDKEKTTMEAMFLIFQEEFENRDHIQGEMLRTLLKRLLITCIRLIKKDEHIQDMSIKQVDLIRKFNILVEQHFKQHHQVVDYADLLFKSPKTLSNFFKKHDIHSPLKIINDRITLEAKRLLQFSDQTAEEIAYELGYKEPSHFSKFFKKQTGKSPLQFRKEKSVL